MAAETELGSLCRWPSAVLALLAPSEAPLGLPLWLIHYVLNDLSSVVP